jgi:hypothetical protein
MKAIFAAMAFLACAFTLAASQPSSPSSSEKLTAQHGAYGRLGTEQSPFFVRSVPIPDSEEEASHKRYEQYEKPSLDRWLTGSTVALAVFTFLLFCFTAALWWATLQLSREARATSKQQAADTQASLKISRDAADAAIKAVEFTESELRAYVFVSADDAAGLGEDGRYFATLALTNRGKTPATEVQCAVMANLQKFPQDVELDNIVHEATGSKASIGAGDGLKQFPALGRPLNDAEKRAIVAEEAALYFWGEAVYKDIFGKLHATTFRFRCMGQDFLRGHLQYCAEGNQHN